MAEDRYIRNARYIDWQERASTPYKPTKYVKYV